MKQKKRTAHLTDAVIARLRPGNTEYIVWDSRVAGLGVRVRPSGHRSFVWHGHADGRVVRMTIGSTALKTVEEARGESVVLQGGARLRIPEGSAGRPLAPLFREFAVDEWKPAFQERWSLLRRKYICSALKRQLLPAFGALRVDCVKRSAIERWFDAYSRTAPGGANMALDLLRQILNAVIAAGHTDRNPTKGIRKNPRRKLTRFLSDAEIQRLLMRENVTG